MFELNVFLRDKLIGRSVFAMDEVRIGRAPDNEVQVDHLVFSRYHAGIEHTKGVYILKDFGSATGTFVNGERIRGRYPLATGDRIQVGKFTLAFACDEPPPAAEARAEAVAGDPSQASEADLRARACPHVAFLEEPSPPGPVPPAVHHLATDVFLLGSDGGCDLVLHPDVAAPPRVAAILRGWTGFSLVALAPGLRRNGEPVAARSELADGDEIAFGASSFRFRAGRADVGSA